VSRCLTADRSLRAKRFELIPSPRRRQATRADFREKWIGISAKVSLEVARIFLLSGNMFRIVAATIAVRESCNYSYARDQFFSTREKSAIRDHGEGICRRAKWIFPSIVRPTYKIEFFYEIKL